ncbi:MAG TPA: TolC family protein [Longimicrobium sp.]|nr:TolC family protein [Longimicrobium sp.]
MTSIHHRSSARRAVGLAAFAALFAAGPVAAQAGRTITYDEAIRIALAQNGTVRLAENDAALDEVSVSQQKMQFLPDLRLNTSGSQSVGRSADAASGIVSDQTTGAMSAGVSSSVTLFDGFANVASLRQARLNRDATQADLARARQTAVFTVANHYVALQARTEELRVRREDLAAREAEERQIQTMVNAGTRSIADLYQQQASVASARLAVVQAEQAVELAKNDLLQTLQLDPRGSYDFPAPAVSEGSAGSYDLDALVARALERRPDLAALETRGEAAEQGVRVAKASSLPTVTLSAGYNTAFSTAADLGFADQLDQRRGGSLSLGVSIPVFDRGATASASERARIQADNARIALETERNEVGLQVRRAYLDHQSAQAQLAAAQAQERAAALALSTAQERYRVGAATLLEVTQARATQVQAASALVSARYNLVLQRTLIAYYVGDLDPENATLG